MIAVLGMLAAALSISVVWPQVWRSCRHGRTLGLSPTTAWLGVALNLCWLTFGVLIGDPAQIVTNAVVGAGNTAVLVALLLTRPSLRHGRMLLRTAAGAAVLAALAAGSLLSVLLLNAHPVVVAAALSGVTSLVGAAAGVPQPLSLLRDRTQDVSGLSPARWRLGAGACASWASYGWLIDAAGGVAVGRLRPDLRRGHVQPPARARCLAGRRCAHARSSGAAGRPGVSHPGTPCAGRGIAASGPARDGGGRRRTASGRRTTGGVQPRRRLTVTQTQGSRRTAPTRRGPL